MSCCSPLASDVVNDEVVIHETIDGRGGSGVVAVDDDDEEESEGELPPRGRAMSFTSAAMVHGVFPPEIGMCDPIINAVLRFAGGGAPSVERIAE